MSHLQMHIGCAGDGRHEGYEHIARGMHGSSCVQQRAAVHLGPEGGLAGYSGGARNCHIYHASWRGQKPGLGASGVLQVVKDLNVTAFLPILGAGRHRSGR